ncbi:MAG: LysM peptidoglycan-binding domain-containing protein [Gammaproteobacteria bacterium]
MRRLVASLAMLLALPALADTLALRDNAPDQYVVVKGDTLWDISGRFLKDPWRWPEIWNLNRKDIKNPHWIYPGDRIVLDRSGTTPRLTLIKGDARGLPTLRLSPGVRATEISDEAIPPIPAGAIQAFLKQPLIIEPGQLDRSPRIVGTNEERVILAAGDTAFATSDGSGTKSWQIYRQGQALTNPDNGELLGHEAIYLGDADTVLPGDPQKLMITRTTQEVLAKDRLLPANQDTVFEFVPHAPEHPVSGRVISAYGGEALSQAGRYQTIVINRGAKDGLEPGHVLAVHRAGRLVKNEKTEGGRQRWVFLDSDCIKPGEKVSFDQPYDPGKVMQDCKSAEVQAGPWAYMDVGCLKPGKHVSFDRFFDPKDAYDRQCVEKKEAETIQLPDSRTGLAMVYRVFDRVAYALIMQSERPVYLLDTVKNP